MSRAISATPFAASPGGIQTLGSPSAKLCPGAEGPITTVAMGLIVAKGPLTPSALDALRSALQAQILAVPAGAPPCVAVDLSAVTSCPARVFPVLTDSYLDAQARGGWLRLVGVSEQVLVALNLARPHEALAVYLASAWARAQSARPHRRGVASVHPRL